MKLRVDLKFLLNVINPWPKVDRNIPVSLWGRIHAYVRELVYPPP